MYCHECLVAIQEEYAAQDGEQAECRECNQKISGAVAYSGLDDIECSTIQSSRQVASKKRKNQPKIADFKPME